ncbi:hypothetical protein L0F63_006438 [Massospora cicadina]|nr:hypothetical protein L0F63_006438 [Massospora cicadina]
MAHRKMGHSFHPIPNSSEEPFEETSQRDSLEDFETLYEEGRSTDTVGFLSLVGTDEAEDAPEILGLRRRGAHQPGLDTPSGLEDTGLEGFLSQDDPSLPGLTFRFWILSLLFGGPLAFTNQFFSFRATPLVIGGFVVQLLAYPLGILLARVLPANRVEFKRLSFSINPGPFNVKEHALITICAGACSGTAYAMDIVVVKRVYYNEPLPMLGALGLLVSTQFLGYGFAGLYRRFLVRPAQMVWPSTLVAVALFRTLHVDRKGANLRVFFAVATTLSFAYYFIPGYLFTLLSSISVLCLAMPANKIAQQLGSGVTGLGLGAISLDWNFFTSYLGSPLVTPFWAQLNTMAGFVLVCWILVPLGFYTNTWEALKYPIFSAGIFDDQGKVYDRARVAPNNTLDLAAYEAYSPLRLSFFFAFTYGVSFATLTALITHTGLHYAKVLLQSFNLREDPHAAAMRRYPEVPASWYLLIFAISLGLGLFAVEAHGLALPWWGLLLAVSTSFIFTLPVGIVTAVTNQMPGLNVLAEFVAGYAFPGQAMANVTFKAFGCVTLLQCLTFLADLKLGQYLKVPPRQMLIAQCVGTLMAVGVNLLTAEWLMGVIPRLCTPEGFPWTCPNTEVFYSASVIWGVIGPSKMFGPGAQAGAPHPILHSIAEVPQLVLGFRPRPHNNLQHVHPPPARPGIYLTWFAVGFVFHVVIRRRWDAWYKRFTLTLSAALDTGVAFGAILIFFLLELPHRRLNWWGNDPDFHCPLASSPGI